MLKILPLIPAALLWSSATAAPQSLFPTSSEITNSAATNATAAGDLDGDGQLDLVLHSRYERTVKFLAGDGSGQFGTPVPLGFWTDNTYRIEVVDLDRDGRTDVLCKSGVSPTEHWFWARQTSTPGDGPGSRWEFELTEVLSVARGTEPTVLADFSPTGTGQYALVVERQHVGVEVYQWDGTAFDATPLLVPYSNPRFMRLLDVNGDGQVDVTAYDQGAQRWRYSSYLGGNQFSTPRSFLPIQAVRSEAIELADIDGDGDSDLIALADNDPRKFLLFERTSPSTFGPPIERFASDGISRYELDALDIDGDGLLDLQMYIEEPPTSGSTSYSIRWHRNLGGFQFAPDEELGEVPLADFNGDGGADAISGGPNSEYFPGGGSLPGPWYADGIALGNVPRGIFGSYRYDADGDGDLDLLMEQSSGPGALFEHRGGLNFAPFRFEDPAIGPPDHIAIADFVGDSQLDLLRRSNLNGALVIQRGLAPDVYAPPVVISSALNGRAYPVDVDGDGDLDIIQSDEFPSGSNVYFIENSGIGNQFPRRIIIGFQEGTLDSIPVDLDGDGLPELVSGESGISGPGVRQNIGGGDFGPPSPLSPAVTTPSSIYGATDFDGDGDTDLLVNLGGTGWIENDGASGFLAPKVLTEEGRDPILIDIDGNGLLDVVERNRALYRLQLSPGVLGGYVQMAPDLDSPRIIGLGDLDGDGDPEAWASLPTTRAIYVVENVATPPAGIAVEVCATAAPNSTGLPGELRGYGASTVTSTDLRLVAVQLPPLQFGSFVGSREVGPPAPVAGSAGSICLRGSIGRYIGPGQVQSSGTAGTIAIDLDPTALLIGTGPVPAVVGETWYFQAWHRDLDGAGIPTSQFTNTLGILIAQ